jgi:hypothetical protein
VAAQALSSNIDIANDIRFFMTPPLGSKSLIVWRHAQPHKLPGRASQFASLEELGLELKIAADLDDEKLLEVTLALDIHPKALLLGRDGFDLDQLAVDRAVRARFERTVSAQPKFDLCINLA